MPAEPLKYSGDAPTGRALRRRGGPFARQGFPSNALGGHRREGGAL